MARTQTVTIPLDEYKELLLRDRPSDHDRELLSRMFEVLSSHLEYEENERSYYSTNVGHHLKVKDADKLVKELVSVLFYVDRERFMQMWNGIASAERERLAQEAMVRQMNEARELRSEGKE